ncbi:hypothetical protein IAT40_007260 [Kwoniella sp. CBS 6097]
MANHGLRWATLPSGQTSCVRYCLDRETTWTYYYTDYLPETGVTKYCACADYGPYIFQAARDERTCPIASPPVRARSDIEAYELMPDWDFQGCYHFKAPSGIRVDDDLPTCEDYCKDHQYLLRRYFPSGEMECTCVDTSDLWGGQALSFCAQASEEEPASDFYVYSHRRLPSAAVRRAERERARRNNMDHAICPDDMTACNVLGGHGLSYECLDVQQELESCGGCLHGGFRTHSDQRPANTPQGVDCTRSLGVDPRGITCEQGKCVTYSCDDGYVLADGTCIPL